MDNLGSVQQAADKIAQSAKEIDVPVWFESRILEDELSFPSLKSSGSQTGIGKDAIELNTKFYRNHTESTDEFWIVEVPTQHSYQIPAYMNFGGENSCPHPREHVAIHKRWNEMYSTQIVAISDDTIEVLVASPPSTMEQALELAREQLVYSPKIIESQQTIDNLAFVLKNSSTWKFIW